MVAMAASKENPPCSSSSSSASAYRSLRTPLSPLQHNSSVARPADHATPAKASRCPAANPNRALLPPLGIKSPPHLARNPTLPRSPNPRKLLRDGAPTLDLASRFKPPKEKDHTPTATPRNKGSIQLCNPRQSKRQMQLFVQQKATPEPFFAEKGGAFCQRRADQAESESSQKPCRKKWRRFPRESVLRSLRGDNAHEGFLGLATTGTEGLNSNANPCTKAKSGLKEAEPLQAHRLDMIEKPFQELSFDIYAGGNFPKENHALVSSSQSVLQASVKNEEADQESIAPFTRGIETCDKVLKNLAEEKALTINMPMQGSPNHATDYSLSLIHTSPNCNKSLSLTLTPPPGRSLSLTPPAERNLTPPMQPTQSPDFIKREGVRMLLPTDGICYAAPSALVKDRRKCKPRGVLTVDAGRETLSSAESDLGFGFHQSVQQIPTPAVASVEWMLEEKRNLGGDASPELVSASTDLLVSASTDLCRMSFSTLSPPHLDSLSEQHKEPKTCPNHEDVHESQQGSFLQASLCVSGYEWGASSSQGMFSSCRTEASSANPRRSIVFNDDEDTDKSWCASTKFKSTVMHNILFEEVPEVSNSSMDFSDEESDVCLTLRGGIPLEGSPPFEYSLLSSLNDKDSSKMNPKAWSNCLPEEVMLSMSGPRDSSLSSQEHEHNGKVDAHSIGVAAYNYVGPLVSFQAGKSSQKGGRRPLDMAPELHQDSSDILSRLAMQKGNCRPLDMAPELHKGSSDISSRLAMAKFLCNITATYLDDIATSLGEDRADVDPTKVAIEKMDNLSLDHSSLMAGRKKMAECCSLLRGLTLETSKSRENSRLASECSVNQPSPSSYEDTADSSHVNAAGCSTRVARRCQEQIFSPFDSLEDDPVKALQACRSLKPSPKAVRALVRRSNLAVEAPLPSKGFVAGAYLLAALFVISHTFNKHLKQAGQVNFCVKARKVPQMCRYQHNMSINLSL